MLSSLVVDTLSKKSLLFFLTNKTRVPRVEELESFTIPCQKVLELGRTILPLSDGVTYTGLGFRMQHLGLRNLALSPRFWFLIWDNPYWLMVLVPTLNNNQVTTTLDSPFGLFRVQGPYMMMLTLVGEGQCTFIIPLSLYSLIGSSNISALQLASYDFSPPDLPTGNHFVHIMASEFTLIPLDLSSTVNGNLSLPLPTPAGYCLYLYVVSSYDWFGMLHSRGITYHVGRGQGYWVGRTRRIRGSEYGGNLECGYGQLYWGHGAWNIPHIYRFPLSFPFPMQDESRRNPSSWLSYNHLLKLSVADHLVDTLPQRFVASIGTVKPHTPLCHPDIHKLASDEYESADPSYEVGVWGFSGVFRLWWLGRDQTTAVCEDECRGLSDESPDDDSDVVGGDKVDNRAAHQRRNVLLRRGALLGGQGNPCLDANYRAGSG
ncbi:hypothetical protein Tco_1311957 [Tanacetum coccineum]